MADIVVREQCGWPGKELNFGPKRGESELRVSAAVQNEPDFHPPGRGGAQRVRDNRRRIRRKAHERQALPGGIDDLDEHGVGMPDGNACHGGPGPDEFEALDLPFGIGGTGC